MFNNLIGNRIKTSEDFYINDVKVGYGTGKREYLKGRDSLQSKCDPLRRFQHISVVYENNRQKWITLINSLMGWFLFSLREKQGWYLLK